MRRSFRERNPLAVGGAGIAAGAALVFLAFNVSIFRGGTAYYAAFNEASGLKPNEDVRIAGVKIGKVSGVELEGDHVKVSFKVDRNVHFGSLSRAQIKIATILGRHYLDIQPSGSSRQSPGQEIPTSRTMPVYDILPALQDVSGQLHNVDVKQLSTAFDTLTQTLSYSPDNVRRTLGGLRKVAQAVASRDDELGQLMSHSRGLTATLADRSGDLTRLVSDGGLLLQELNARSAVIQSLLSGTIALSQQVIGAIQDNRAALGPAMTQLHRLVNVLERNQGRLEKSLETLGPFVTTSADGASTGRWFDGWVQNLIPLPASIQPPPSDGASSKAKTPDSIGGPTLPFIQ